MRIQIPVKYKKNFDISSEGLCWEVSSVSREKHVWFYTSKYKINHIVFFSMLRLKRKELAKNVLPVDILV